MNLIGYLRVSSETQLDGFGLDTQEASIRAWALTQGHRLATVSSDAGISGATEALDRPGLAEALDAVIQGSADGIVVARLDRLARSLSIQEATLAMVWNAGAEVFTVDHGMVLRDDVDDPLRTALRQVVGVFSELERRMVVKRLKDGRQAKSATGRKATGSYAYGWEGTGRGRNRDALPVAEEQQAIQMIVQLREAGLSYRAICARLAELKVPPRRASAWSPMTVRGIVARCMGHSVDSGQARDLRSPGIENTAPLPPLSS